MRPNLYHNFGVLPAVLNGVLKPKLFANLNTGLVGRC